ncbi:LuxR C-terminal-related transcriptional regulator [Kitasatospora sp. NPDC057542]|uniref:helix-turn-helix transcriptional regulator n=1 Tax=Streptomycetaceae TaxID=2062 RepID=UPI001CC9CA9C|nr:helix-turn-helix transcriptional regulator [Streptomyces sp. LS1784]
MRTPDTTAELVRGLLELRLLHPAPGRPGVLLPSSPQTAMAEFAHPIEAEIKERHQRLEQRKSRLLPLSSVYFEGRKARNVRESFDVVTDVDRVRAVLAQAARACAVEVFSAHPGVFSEQAVESSLPQDLELLRRGVRMRTLYQHPVRTNRPMRELIGTLTAEGCEVRTCEEIHDRTVIFDRETAFIPNRFGDPGAVVIREPSVVDLLYRGLEQLWAAATACPEDARPARTTDVLDEEIKRAIVRMLADGARDETIARRLGVSLRTCRRHIAEVMERLDASSRFQAGVRAADVGWLGRGDAGQQRVGV